MKEFKGTPGPWRVGDKDGIFTSVVHDSEGIGMCPHVLAKVTTRYSSSEQAIANANLIAAAPELLEALQEMVAIVKKHTYPQPDKPSTPYARAEWAESIINKALGE